MNTPSSSSNLADRYWYFGDSGISGTKDLYTIQNIEKKEVVEAD